MTDKQPIYAELPPSVDEYRYGGGLFTEAQIRTFADATHALRVALAAPQQAAPAVPYKDGTPHLNVGDSSFESWYESYNPAHKSDKQRARDAYAAGMGDPLVVAAPQQEVQELNRLRAMEHAFHKLMEKHGLHPGRTDDDLFQILDAHLQEKTPEPIGEVVVGEGPTGGMWNVIKWRKGAPPITPGMKLYTAQPAPSRDADRALFDAGWKACARFCDREDVSFDGIVGDTGCPQFEAAYDAARKEANKP